MNNAFNICLDNIGLKEIKGNKHNAKILEAFKISGNGWIKDDETAWCAAWMCYCFHHAGMDFIKTVRARDWEKYGTETKTPQKGDLVVLWRIAESSNYGHVGFYIDEDETHVLVLGGNQNDQVCIQKLKKGQVLSYRKVEATETKTPTLEEVNALKLRIQVLEQTNNEFVKDFVEIAALADKIERLAT